LIVRRPGCRYGRVQLRPWLLVGVVESTALAREIVALAQEAWPQDELRVFNLVSFERELTSLERERLFESLYNPTVDQKERLATFRTIAEACLEAAEAVAGEAAM
jgi:hypothetical protein